MNLARLIDFRSTTARFAALSLLLLALTSGLTLAVAAQLASHTIEQGVREATAATAVAIEETFKRSGPAEAAQLVQAELDAGPQRLMLLEGPGGMILAGNAQGWPPTVAVPTRWREMDLFTAGRDEPDRFGLLARRLDANHRLLVGHSLSERTRLLRGLGDAMLGALALSLLLAIGGAWALSRFIADRIEAAADAADAVSGGDLARRVPLDGSGDAFDELAGALNVMLARIEELVSGMRTVTDSLAHDLRSPLTRIKARIERALATPDPIAQRAALEAVSAEADGLLRMLTVALEVSRAEAGIGRENHEPVDAAALLRDLAEMYEPLAEDRGFSLSVDAPGALLLIAHREFLGQALANLIDNALKHSGGTRIALKAARDDATVRLTVADDGIGIADTDRSRATERHVRLDAARSTPGSGLGLSLAIAVARMHGGKLELADARPGLAVTLAVPAESLTEGG